MDFNGWLHGSLFSLSTPPSFLIGDMKVPAKVALAASASDTSQPPAKRIKAAQFTFSTSKAKPRDSLAQPPSAASVPSPPPSQPTCSTTPAAPLLEPTMLKIARTQEACQAQTSFPSSAHSHAIPSTASFLASAAMGLCIACSCLLFHTPVFIGISSLVALLFVARVRTLQALTITKLPCMLLSLFHPIACVFMPLS